MDKNRLQDTEIQLDLGLCVKVLGKRLGDNQREHKRCFCKDLDGLGSRADLAPGDCLVGLGARIAAVVVCGRVDKYSKVRAVSLLTVSGLEGIRDIPSDLRLACGV
jgi:hypothetical protein